MSKIIFMGSPDIAVPSLRALHEAEHQILAAVTQPDKPQGRGQKLAAPPVKVAAQGMGLKVLQPQRIKTSEFIAELRSLNPDFICVVAYGKLLSPELLKLPRFGCVNLHFSLLPKYRGASCVAHALIHGEEETGVTTMLMDEGLDTGPILMKWSENILADDTTETLSQRLAILGAQQLVKTLEEMEKGTLEPIPQGEGASYAPLLKKEMGKVDWSRPAREIYNLYRGLTPWPGLFSYLEGKRILLMQLRLVAPLSKSPPSPASTSPGAVHLGLAGEMLVQTGSGPIEILRLKPEGKSDLTAQEFMRGLHSKDKLIFK
jgi:methionyl-tRNA formyltransferase